MTKEYSNDAKAAERTSGGGQLGGTYYGQEPDAKTASRENDRKNPNDKNR